MPDAAAAATDASSASSSRARFLPTSLRARLSLGLGGLALVFLAGVGIVLDRAFAASVLRGAEARIDVYLLASVGLAEINGDRLRLREALLDRRFVQPGSGVYGIAHDLRGGVAWRSSSTLGRDVGLLARRAAPTPGNIRYELLDSPSLGPLLLGELAVTFERPKRSPARYVFVVALDRALLDREIGAFRNALWMGLGAAALLLLLATFWWFRVVTRPLRELTARVAAIEAGEASALGGGWPDELAGVTAHLDRFIDQERALRERYRTLTDDLAHSLKTPLAVLRNATDETAPDGALARAQIERMESVLRNRFERVVVRPVFMNRGVPAEPVLRELTSALSRLYPQRRIALAVTPELRFPGESRDLLELCGNLADNACKYGRAEVRISAQAAAHGGARFELIVEDDGEGIPDVLHDAVRQRGVRADMRGPSIEGQGIGLAVVDKLVAAYGGSLTIGASALGGARVVVGLPG